MDIFGVTNEAGEALSRWDIKQKLEDMGISEDAINSGDSDAITQDAEAKGISSSELQAALEPTVKGSGDKVQSDFQTELKSKGVPDNVISQGKDAVQAYASQYGIALPQAPSGANLNIKS